MPFQRESPLNFLTLAWFAVLIGLTLIVAWLRSPHVIGRIGERRTTRLFSSVLAGTPHVLFRDVTLPIDDGTTQIDLLVLSNRGIFVVEIKTMKGKISGGPQKKRWHAQIGRRSYRFVNPVHQNHGHLKAVQKLLGVERGVLVPLVIMQGRAKMTKKVRALVALPDDIQKIVSAASDDCISQSEIAGYAKIIKNARLPPGRRTDKLHRKNLRKRIRSRIGPQPCPHCGGPMEKRIARKGDRQGESFWGCRAFPRCRGNLPLESESVD